MKTCSGSRRQDDAITHVLVTEYLSCSYMNRAESGILNPSHLKPDWKPNSCGNNWTQTSAFLWVWGEEMCVADHKAMPWEQECIGDFCGLPPLLSCSHETCRKSVVLWFCWNQHKEWKVTPGRSRVGITCTFTQDAPMYPAASVKGAANASYFPFFTPETPLFPSGEA